MLTQFKTLHDVKQRRFRQAFSMADLVKAGDAGIGTFNDVKGEMVALDGKIYRTLADGSCEDVTHIEDHTPYSLMFSTKDQSFDQFDVSGVTDMDDLQAKLKDLLSDPEQPFYIHIAGTFDSLVSRSPDGFEPPYPSLEEIIAAQPDFPTDNIEGDIVGFYTPDHLAELGVPGFHLHFLSKDKTTGGHLKQISTGTFQARIYPINTITVHM